ncbi:rubisco accumulation factor 1.1, chloroplastic-like [Coffea eugenioides]|uniref:Rubisco accumulation factor 1.1, chloroplastic-like n=1 Tax=Coffea arabica TaxID=13443 RepID=F1DGA4_COFAR|nr:rubisco accumulation factor 1.1, chloroplastic-like [Coffea arabica]XP_027161954.1 rubisco accumulation factor 1.1, chloroplastic-like [Coffea eugenioides]ADY38792.1 hypothetical protein MA29G21.11 [Coffea arabica]
MLSLTMINTAKPLSLSTPFLPSLLNPHKLLPPLPRSKHPNSVVALIIPPKSSAAQQQQLYQPFRPPPSPLPPQYRNLDTNGRLEILSNRLGLWFEYAPLISALFQEGFTPPTLEEITGISGVEQNRLVVAAQVRESLVQSEIDPDILSFFDTGGAELLYEIRLLSASQRASAAKYLVLNKFDARMTLELARAIKDKPRRKGEKGWESFDGDLPGDCLAFMYFRQAQEHRTASSPELSRSALERALQAVESENGRERVLEELEGKKDGEDKDKVGAAADRVVVPVVRMQIGEVAESSVVAVLPVCRAEEREVKVEEAPWECAGVGDFGVVEAEKGWSRWVVLPGWEPVAGLKRGGVAVAFKNARVLPWRAKKWNRGEAILVVADRGRKGVVTDDNFYLVVGGGNGSVGEGLKVERGLELKEIGVKESLGTVVLVVRPPREEYDDQLSDED